MRRIAALALLAFAATAGVDWPAPPGAERVRYADLFAAAAAVAFALSGKSRQPLATALAPGVGLALWTGISAAVHGEGAATALGAAELAVVLGLGAVLGREPAVRDRLLRAWTAGAGVAAAVGLVTAGLVLAGVDTGPLHVGGGELGLAWRPAGLCRTGMLAAWILVPFLLLWLDGERLAGRARGPLLALFGLTLALTLTRTLLAVPFALAVAQVQVQARPGRRAGRVAVGALLVAAALASIRLDVHGTGEPGIRWRIAASALANAASHPLFGVGPAAAAALTGWPGAHDPPYPWDAHSTLLDLAATRGLPAALLFAATAAMVWRAARRAPGDATSRALLAGLAAVCFDALTLDVADFRHVWLLFGLAAAGREPGG